MTGFFVIQHNWIPAFAGMTAVFAISSRSHAPAWERIHGSEQNPFQYPGPGIRFKVNGCSYKYFLVGNAHPARLSSILCPLSSILCICLTINLINRKTPFIDLHFLFTRLYQINIEALGQTNQKDQNIRHFISH